MCNALCRQHKDRCLAGGHFVKDKKGRTIHYHYIGQSLKTCQFIVQEKPIEEAAQP